MRGSAGSLPCRSATLMCGETATMPPASTASMTWWMVHTVLVLPCAARSSAGVFPGDGAWRLPHTPYSPMSGSPEMVGTKLARVYFSSLVYLHETVLGV